MCLTWIILNQKRINNKDKRHRKCCSNRWSFFTDSRWRGICGIEIVRCHDNYMYRLDITPVFAVFFVVTTFFSIRTSFTTHKASWNGTILISYILTYRGAQIIVSHMAFGSECDIWWRKPVDTNFSFKFFFRNTKSNCL